MKKAFSFAAVLLLVSAARPFAQAQTPAPQPQSSGMILEQVLVKVNGEIFTKTELEAKQITELRAQNRQINNPADLKNDESLKAMLIQITPDILVDSSTNASDSAAARLAPTPTIPSLRTGSRSRTTSRPTRSFAPRCFRKA